MSIEKALFDAVMKVYQSKGVGKFFSINFSEETDGEFVFEVCFPPDCLNPQGNVQGGMITSVLDDCTALCVLFSTKGKRDCFSPWGTTDRKASSQITSLWLLKSISMEKRNLGAEIKNKKETTNKSKQDKFFEFPFSSFLSS